MRKMTSGALSLLVGAVMIGGCGAEEPSPEPEPATSPTSASPSDVEPDPEPAEPSVEPASGAEVEIGSLTVTLPKGFKPRRASSIGGDLVTASGPGTERIALVAAEDFNHQTLAEAVDIAIETGFWDDKPKRLPDVEVDGVTMYHLKGRSGYGGTDVQFGTEHGGYDMSILIGATEGAAEVQQLVDSIMATASWR